MAVHRHPRARPVLAHHLGGGHHAVVRGRLDRPACGDRVGRAHLGDCGHLHPGCPLPRRRHRRADHARVRGGRSGQGVGDRRSRRLPPGVLRIAGQLSADHRFRPGRARRALVGTRRGLPARAVERRLGRRGPGAERPPVPGRGEQPLLHRQAESQLRRRRPGDDRSRSGVLQRWLGRRAAQRGNRRQHFHRDRHDRGGQHPLLRQLRGPGAGLGHLRRGRRTGS